MNVCSDGYSRILRLRKLPAGFSLFRDLEEQSPKKNAWSNVRYI